MIEPALALLDFSSIAVGIQAADAMIKRAQVDVIKAGSVQPGRFLVLLGGSVGEVEESLAAGREIGGDALLDDVFLPQVHPDVVEAIGGLRRPDRIDAVGIVETRTIPAAIHAADAGVKGALVRLVEIRMADGLGGKGIVLFSGLIADVEMAVELGVNALARRELLIQSVVIPQLHPAMWENLGKTSLFSRLIVEQP